MKCNPNPNLDPTPLEGSLCTSWREKRSLRMISRISAGKSGSGNDGSGSSAPLPESEAAAPSSDAAPCAAALVQLLSSGMRRHT